MRVIALNGSPRKGGNTDILIDEFLRGAEEVGAQCEKLYLYDYNINPPGELADLHSERVDIHAGDDHRLVLNRVMDADVVVLGSPVFWQGITSQMKCFVDRFSCHYTKDWFNEGMSGKIWAVIVPFASPDPNECRWVTEPVKVWVKHFKGTYLGEVAVSVFAKGAVRDKPSALQAAYELGKKAAESRG